MERSLEEQRFLGYIGYLVREYGPKVEAAFRNFYHDPESFYKTVEEFRSRYQLAVDAMRR